MTSLATETEWPLEILDRDYSARGTVSTEVLGEDLRRYRSRSDEARVSVGKLFDIEYDTESGQTFDVFGTEQGKPRPVFFYVHGGYWRMLSKDDSSFMAPALAAQGIATVAPDYRLAPTVGLGEIVREVRAALAFLWRNGDTLGIDRNRIFVGGSSAGGHLAATLLAGGWHREFGIPEDAVKGALLVSGLYHLGPVVISHARDWITLTQDEIVRLSPAVNLPARGCPIVVAYSAEESAGFARQSQEFDRLWREAGFPSRLLKVEDRHHFNVTHDLTDPNTELSRALHDLVFAQQRNS